MRHDPIPAARIAKQAEAARVALYRRLWRTHEPDGRLIRQAS